MRLQSKISLILLPLSIIPLLGLGWYAYGVLEETSRERSLKELTVLLDQFVQHTQSEVATLEANVKLFAKSVLLQKYVLTEDEEDRYNLLQTPLLKLFHSYIENFPRYSEIRVLLPDGFEDTRATRGRIPNHTEEEAESELFRLLATTEKVVFLCMLENPDNGRYVLYAGMPLKLTDLTQDPVLATPKLRAYLVVTMDLDPLVERIKHTRVGMTGTLFLIKGGRVLFHRDARYARTGVAQDQLHQIKRSAATGEPFLGSMGSGQGIYAARAIENLQTDEIYVAGMLPEKELEAASQQLGNVLIVITLVSILVMAVLLIGLVRYLLVRPVRNLQLAAQEIGRGHLTPEVQIDTRDEFGDLARSFKEMGESVLASARQIQYLAYHDSLTGLPNRLMFREYLTLTLHRATRYNEHMAILFLDLDDFKRVNDTLGHGIGDQLLKEVGDRLSTILRCADLVARDTSDKPGDIVARLGGDEFIILLTENRESTGAGVVAQRVLDELAKPFLISGHDLFAGTSIGITVFPKDGRDANSLIKNADLAMYHAKEQGKNNFQFYSKSLDRTARERLAIEARLRQALQRGDLSLHFQPQVDTRTHRILGLEALLRWHDEELGFVPPDRFIPIAEESGLILPIGEWTLETACRQCKAWQDAGLSHVMVAVNISGVQFTRQDLPEMLQRVLHNTGLEPGYLEIEVTETTVMSVGGDMVDRLDQIKRLGLQIALDDFGTGYSSLSYLSRFPIDTLKIDRAFINELGNGTDRDSIVSAILALAKSLSLNTTAEGVETLDQLRYLENAGCDMIQGYLFSKPLPVPEIDRLLANPMRLALAPASAAAGEHQAS